MSTPDINDKFDAERWAKTYAVVLGLDEPRGRLARAWRWVSRVLLRKPAPTLRQRLAKLDDA